MKICVYYIMRDDNGKALAEYNICNKEPFAEVTIYRDLHDARAILSKMRFRFPDNTYSIRQITIPLAIKASVKSLEKCLLLEAECVYSGGKD